MSDQAIVSIVTTLIAVLGTLAGVQITIRAGQKAEKRKVVSDKLEDIMNFTIQDRSCHAEQSEASRGPSRETLRGVYPGAKRRAQGDKTLPMLVVKFHYILVNQVSTWAAYQHERLWNV